MQALSPCPFCGGRATFSRIPGQGFSLLCGNCGAIAMKDGDNSRPALEAAWNRREVRHNFSQANQYKPCPFCASRISLGKLPGHSSILKCTSCGMMVSFVGSDELSTTMQKWNRRTGR